MPARSRYFTMADKMVEGRLAELLRRMKDEGDSFSTIAARLRAEHDIEVSPQGVANWLARLDAEVKAS